MSVRNQTDCKNTNCGIPVCEPCKCKKYKSSKEIITEQELKEKTTPEIIKKMVELAEGFKLENDGYNLGVEDPFGNFYFEEDCIPKNMESFPLLLHRAVEGWNEKHEDRAFLLLRGEIQQTYNYRLWKLYEFKNYQSCHLTQCEMAIWDCLLNIL